MVMTNFPDGLTSFGIPLIGNGIPTGGGSYFFVDSVHGADGYDGSWEAPFATIDYAIGKCTADKGDVIVTKPGHAETVASSSAITFDVAGVTLYCMGNGGERATLTFSTSASASVVISADNVTVMGLRGVAGINALTTPITITGDNANVDIEWFDGSTSIEALYIVRATTVSNLALNLVAKNFIGGTGGTGAVGLVEVTKGRINLDVYGKWSVAAVNMLTTASTDVEVRGTIYNTSSSGANKDVVETGVSGTWFAEIWDAQAGALYAGGSGTGGTLSAADPSAIGSNVTTILAQLSGAAGVASWPTAAAYANAVSIAEVLGYIQDAVRNGSGSALPTNKGLADIFGAGFTGAAGHTFAAALGTDGTTVTDSATSVLGAIGANSADNSFASASVAANEDGSVLERLEQLQKAVNNGSGTAIATNKSLVDCLGTTGSATADSATSIVGILGSNTATTAFASGSVLPDVDGNVLERLEALAQQTAAGCPSVKNPNYFVVTADMASATWNTQDSHTIATVTGMVQMTIIPQCTDTLTDAADGAMIQLGITGATDAIIAVTNAAGKSATTISTGEFWVDASPVEVVVTKTALDNLTVVVGGGTDVGYEITGAALTGGTLKFHIYWTPLDATGAVAAGAGGTLA